MWTWRGVHHCDKGLRLPLGPPWHHPRLCCLCLCFRAWRVKCIATTLLKFPGSRVTSGMCPLPPTGAEGAQEVPYAQRSPPLLGAGASPRAFTELLHTGPPPWRRPAAPPGQPPPGAQPAGSACSAPAGIGPTSQQRPRQVRVSEEQVLVLFAHRGPLPSPLGCPAVSLGHRCPGALGAGVETRPPPLH